MLLSAPSFKLRRHSLTYQCHGELHVDHQTVTYCSQFCRKFVIWVFPYSFFFGGGGDVCRGKLCKPVELDESCFSRRMCGCNRLRARALVFVDVKQDLGRPVLQMLLIVPWRYCLLSLQRVSFPAPQSSVTVGTSNIHLGSEGLAHHTVERCVFSMDSLTGAHTKKIKATLKKVTVHLRHYWENNVKCVINRFKNSLSALFDGVPELIVKWSVQFSTNPLVLIFHLFFLTGYFPNT